MSELEKIVLFIFGVIGLTHIVIDGSIFQWFRDLMDKYLSSKLSSLFHCHLCFGFWTGLFASWAVFNNISILQIFVGGGAGSFLSMTAALLFNYIEAKTIVNLKE